VEKVDHSKCKFCRREFPKSELKVGRTRVFCDDACRRGAEFEIRRVNDRLVTLECRVSECRMGHLPSFDDPMALETEICRHRDRLLELFETSETV
jgi:hypothetical protein